MHQEGATIRFQAARKWAINAAPAMLLTAPWHLGACKCLHDVIGSTGVPSCPAKGGVITWQVPFKPRRQLHALCRAVQAPALRTSSERCSNSSTRGSTAGA